MKAILKDVLQREPVMWVLVACLVLGGFSLPVMPILAYGSLCLLLGNVWQYLGSPRVYESLPIARKSIRAAVWMLVVGIPVLMIAFFAFLSAFLIGPTSNSCLRVASESFFLGATLSVALLAQRASASSQHANSRTNGMARPIAGRLWFLISSTSTLIVLLGLFYMPPDMPHVLVTIASAVVVAASYLQYVYELSLGKPLTLHAIYPQVSPVRRLPMPVVTSGHRRRMFGPWTGLFAFWAVLTGFTLGGIWLISRTNYISWIPRADADWIGLLLYTLPIFLPMVTAASEAKWRPSLRLLRSLPIARWALALVLFALLQAATLFSLLLWTCASLLYSGRDKLGATLTVAVIIYLACAVSALGKTRLQTIAVLLAIGFLLPIAMVIAAFPYPVEINAVLPEALFIVLLPGFYARVYWSLANSSALYRRQLPWNAKGLDDWWME